MAQSITIGSEIDVLKVALERIRLRVTKHISAFELYQMRDPSAVADKIAFQINAEVLGHINKSIEVRYPSDWWQALKERFAPAWFARRWPVEYHVVELKGYDLVRSDDLPPLWETVPYLLRVDGEK